MIRALLVGAGRWGRVLVNSVHGVSDKITFTAGLKTTASDEDIAFAREKGYDLLTGPFEEAIMRRDVDAVVLASPHSLHGEQIAAAAKAGKPIACEKPFTLDAASARAAIACAEEAGVPLAVLHNRRFIPVYQEVQRLVHEGTLGKICHIEANFSSRSAIENAVETRPWRADPAESPLGSMTNRGIHGLDAMVGCCGPLAKVMATAYNCTGGARVDTTSCLLWFQNGITGYLGTLNATVSHETLKVFGVDGTAEMRGWQELILHRPGEAPVATKFEDCDIERAELEAFADMLAAGASFPPRYPMTPDQMAAVPAFLEAAVASAETGRPVETN